jgi:hypothetical protein
MALPLDLQFATKGQLAQAIVCDALGDGVIVDFVCGDEVRMGVHRSLLAPAQPADPPAHPHRRAGLPLLPRARGPAGRHDPPHPRRRAPLAEEDFEFAKDGLGLDQSQVRRLIAATARPSPPGHAEHWSGWTRSHQARARWFHHRARLARNQDITLKPSGQLTNGGCRTSHRVPRGGG